jgi:uncharacterized membrane protein YedE/YeeE
MESYKPSGKVSPVSVALLLGTGLFVTPLLGLVYVLIQDFMPLIYLNFLLTIGFGFALSYVTGYAVIKPGKVRNPYIAIAFSLVGVAIAGYIHWGIWLNFMLDRSDVSITNIAFLLTNPDVMVDYIKIINQEGIWSVGKVGREGSAVNGDMLSFIWISEAVIIGGLATKVPYKLSRQPYCETHNKWFEKSELEPLNLIEQPEELLQKIEANDATAFNALERANRPDENFHSRWFLHTCEGDVNYLTIANMIPSYEKNKVRFNKKDIVNNIKISSEMKNALAERIKAVYG